jgi:hypothetical protein
MPKTENKIKPAAVFAEFNRIVQEYREKYGEIATRIDKNYLYEQVAKPFMISPKYAGQLIRHVMKHQREYAYLKEDIAEVMEALAKVKTPTNKFI